MSEAEQIDEFIRSHGVTHCPTAYVAPSSAKVSDADLNELADHNKKRARRERYGRRYKAKTPVCTIIPFMDLSFGVGYV